MLKQIALALDMTEEESIRQLLFLLEPKPQIIKIGLEIIASLGIERALILLKELSPESEIFLDFKLHDIPNTVCRAIEALKKYKQIKYLTVHILGGKKMLSEALKATEGQINLIGVTVLTSHSEEEILQDFSVNLNDTTHQLVELANKANLQYLVASVWECKKIKELYPHFKIITPGIRLNESSAQDQARIATPQKAIEEGVDILVIGRPIYSAQDPKNIWNKLIC